MRDLEEAYRAGNPDAQRALRTYAYAIIKYIGAYTAVLNGVDAITFTAGVGENSSLVRQLVCSRLTYIGVELDDEANSNVKGPALISTASSKIKVFVIPTDEELSIARQTEELIRNRDENQASPELN